MKKVTEIDSIDDVELELIQSGKLKETNEFSHNYVNNKELYQEFVQYKKLKDKLYKEFYHKTLKPFNVLNEKDLSNENKIIFDMQMKQFVPPKVSDKIGAAIIQIATRRCNSRQYVGYSNNWKEELVANAIMTASIRCHNFDPERSNNPFAYLTQICDNAIKEQIKKEKKQLYVKYKSMEEANGFQGELDENNMEEGQLDHHMESAPSDQRRKYIDDYETVHFPKKDKTQEEPEGGLTEFFE